MAKIFKNKINKLTDAIHNARTKSLNRKRDLYDIKNTNKRKQLENQKIKAEINKSKFDNSKWSQKKKLDHELKMAELKAQGRDKSAFYKAQSEMARHKWKNTLAAGVSGQQTVDSLVNGNNESDIVEAIRKSIG